MYKESFPSRLKRAREDTGLTQREVSKETGISQPSLAQYETGTREPDIETLGLLSDFYKKSLDWLIGTEQQRLSSETIKKHQETKERNEILKELGHLG